MGGERRKDDRCCRCVRAPQGSLQAGGKQAGAHAIARDARHRGGTAACERRGSRRPSWGGKGAGAAEETPGQHQHSRPLQGGGAWGLGARASRAAPPGVQACDRGEDAGPEPPRCPGEQARCLSPRPCRKGGQGRVAAEAPAAGRRTQGGSGGWSQVQAGRLAREGAGRLAHGVGGGWGSSARCCWTRGEAGSWRGTWLSCWKCTGGREGGANGQRHWAQLGKASLAELAGRCRGRVDRAPGHGALGEPAGPGPEEDQHLSQQGEPIGPRPPSRAWNWSTEAPPAPRTPRT